MFASRGTIARQSRPTAKHDMRLACCGDPAPQGPNIIGDHLPCNAVLNLNKRAQRGSSETPHPPVSVQGVGSIWLLSHIHVHRAACCRRTTAWLVQQPVLPLVLLAAVMRSSAAVAHQQTHACVISQAGHCGWRTVLPQTARRQSTAAWQACCNLGSVTGIACAG
eukprot:245201-Chlamydomonas_euryale.AAC.3